MDGEAMVDEKKHPRLQQLLRAEADGIEGLKRIDEILDRLKSLDAEIAAAITCGDRRKAVELAPKIICALTELEIVKLEEHVRVTRLTKFIIASEEF